ncbi:LuxR family transcriptional regulator [Saccharopolyspora indica]|uniref:LuxR family transcriptional regulator n=1 Tax=Saccharopolyspora indica TaxID=1229659 RepID=UPI0022EB18E4|nr:LuxR family transcriptional regulator [Saccharopolyspora indica]MDA3649642.1 LuxR family transcriptional regulator [Saccharopolyspora indica]
MISGRVDELAAITGVLRAARSGSGGALVIRGEAGIGKSALLHHLDDDGMRLLRGSGVEAESELPYAGLHLLLRTAAHRFDELPAEQAGALRTAFGAGDADRFLVGLAVLTLFGMLAAERPLLCVVDDAHWLDAASAEALLFAARRLDTEPVALLFAVREPHAPEFPAPGVPELHLDGLDDAAADALLPADLLDDIRTRILGEARGNPLALLELPAFRTALGYEPAPLRTPVQRMLAARIAGQPPRTRTLLLVAALVDTGEAAVVLDAAESLGASIEDLAPAERAGLLHLVGGTFVFGHPLLQSTACCGAEVARRLEAHRALADRLDRGRRAWHLAAATVQPDEEIAAELEESAAEVRRRGGYAAVAALCERAAALTPDRRQRGRRLIAAAKAAADAGRPERAAGFVADTAGFLTDPVDLAEAAGVDALLAQERGGQPYRALIEEAADVAARAPELAGRLLFRAAKNAWESGDLAAVVDAARSADALGRTNSDLVAALARAATGFHRLTSGGATDGVAAVREMRSALGPPAGPPRKRVMIVWSHVWLGDFRTAHSLASALADSCRAEGALGALPDAVAVLALTQMQLGMHGEAWTSGTEGLRLAEELGHASATGVLTVVLAHLAAIEGDDERCRSLLSEARKHGVPPVALRATRALNLADLAAGRPEAVVARADDIAAGLTRMDARNGLPDLVEAAVRTGRPERAQEPCDWYVDWATHIGRPWAAAIAQRCRALLSEDPEPHYAAAVRLHRDGDEVPFERARTELLYGEWLRRRQRRVDARVQLRSALESFERLSARPWAERAREELRATGESRPPTEQPRLTPQERQVVRLAATGLTNRDIGAQLFLSPRTVGYHLSNAYAKLGVTSRLELAHLPGLAG